MEYDRDDSFPLDFRAIFSFWYADPPSSEVGKNKNKLNQNLSNFFLWDSPQAPDAFGLHTPTSQLVIVYHWLVFLNQVLKQTKYSRLSHQFPRNFEYKINHISQKHKITKIWIEIQEHNCWCIDVWYLLLSYANIYVVPQYAIHTLYLAPTL